MTDLLARVLVDVSNALLVPDILALLVLCVLTLVQAGGLLGEFLARRREGEAFRAFVARLKSDSMAGARAPSIAEVPRGTGLAALAFRAGGPGLAASREKVIDDLELRAARLLGRLHLGIRLGPVLGLAGTLIPLGPALIAMSHGDVSALASQLVVAFGTAVLGMFVGGTCFFLHWVRRHWYAQDLSDIEFVLDRVDDPSGAAP